MVGQAAWADIVRAGRAGTMRRVQRVRRRPRVVFAKFHPQPTVGQSTRLSIASRYAGGAELCVQQDGGTILYKGPVPPNSELMVTPPTPAIIRVSLALEPSSGLVEVGPRVTHEFQVTPIVTRPPLRVDVPGRISAGDRLTVVWEAPTAKCVRFYVDYGDRREEFLEPPSGVRIIIPARPGAIGLRLVAEGDFAKTIFSHTARVVIPAVQIVVDRPVQAGLPGSEISYSWRITGARQAYLEAPSRNERRMVPLSETVFVTLGDRGEDFLLIAIGFDDRLHAKRLSAIPRRIAHFDEPSV